MTKPTYTIVRMHIHFCGLFAAIPAALLDKPDQQPDQYMEQICHDTLARASRYVSSDTETCTPEEVKIEIVLPNISHENWFLNYDGLPVITGHPNHIDPIILRSLLALYQAGSNRPKIMVNPEYTALLAQQKANQMAGDLINAARQRLREDQ